MKKITSLLLFLISLQLLSPVSAQAQVQCKKLFETIEVSDRTKADARNEGAYFVAAINTIAGAMKSVPFGKKIEGWPSEYTRAIQSASAMLNTNGLDYAKLARLDFSIKPGASDKLRQKIRVLIENEIAVSSTQSSSNTNFKFFFKLVQLANYPKAQHDWILQKFLENKLKGLEIERTEVLIPLIIENAEKPNEGPFFKVIQETETTLLLVSNERDLQFSHYVDPAENMEDLGIHFFQMTPSENGYRDMTYNGKDYALDISQKRAEKFELYKRQLKPRLNEMWKDKELSGSVIIDTQFTNDGTWLVDEYKEYYKEQGFQFARVRSATIEEAFVNPFVTGKMDYLVAEHSGSLTVSVRPQVLVGTRETPKGVESIHIIYSLPDDPQQPGNQLYTFDMERELPRLVRVRNSNKVETELIYINGQCYTADELKELSKRVDSAYFTYIAPSSLAETFSNSSSSPLQTLVTGIRKGLNYSDIQKKMEKSQVENYRENSYETSPGENSFRLPHEPLEKRVDNQNSDDKTSSQTIKYTIKLVDDKNKKQDVDFIPLNGAR